MRVWLLGGLCLLLAAPAGAHSVAPQGAERGTDQRTGARVLHQDPPSQARQWSQQHLGSYGRQAWSGLPLQWCGQPAAADRPTLPQQADLPVYKLLLAYPRSTSARRLQYLRTLLQSNLAQVEAFVAQQSGGRKTLRWDMGTECGEQYLDIQEVPLPGEVNDYLYGPTPDYPEQRWPWGGAPRLQQELHVAMRDTTHPLRNFLLYLDGWNVEQRRRSDGSWQQLNYDWTWGSASMYQHDQPDSDQQLNLQGGLVAWIYGAAPAAFAGGLPVPDPSQGWSPSIMAHELFHTLGAVQPSAPNATPWLHCRDGEDIMCYQDSGDPGSVQFSRCPAIAWGLFTQALDCGGDDYFAAAPAPGSYLDQHWNTYRSPFLGSCTELARACAGPDSSRPADQLPPPRLRLQALRRRGRWEVQARLQPPARGRGQLQRMELQVGRQRLLRRRAPWRWWLTRDQLRHRLQARAAYQLGPELISPVLRLPRG